MLLRNQRLEETEIHRVLSNRRRREVLEHLGSRPGRVGVWELAGAIAESETGSSPPPPDIQKSVYISLHQTHLPKLQQLGIVNYDRDENQIEMLDKARAVSVYMEVVGRYGITWAEYYRMLGTLGLFTVIAALVGVPVVAAVDPVLWASAFLALVGASTGYQLWTKRWAIVRQLFG